MDSRNEDALKEAIEKAHAEAAEKEAEEAKAEEELNEEAPEEEAEEAAEAAGERPSEEGEEDASEEETAEELFARRKAKNKKKKTNPLEEKLAEVTDQLKRQMAEFDNFRKRTEKEKSRMYEIGASDVVGKILPVIDNFERGLAAVPEEQKGDPFVDGMDKIYKQMLTALEELGVKPIEAVGKPFDPNLHNAVMHVEDEEAEENTVVEEFQKGYTYRDTVIRHSMVKVAN